MPLCIQAQATEHLEDRALRLTFTEKVERRYLSEVASRRFKMRTVRHRNALLSPEKPSSLDLGRDGADEMGCLLKPSLDVRGILTVYLRLAAALRHQHLMFLGDSLRYSF